MTSQDKNDTEVQQKIEVISLFPEIFESFLGTSLIKKAIQRSLLSIRIEDPRKFADPPHYHVDDTPYGGGPGMVISAPPIINAIEDAKTRLPNSQVFLMSASGRLFNQEKAIAISKIKELIIICGRYEGIDQRVIDLAVDEEISIGDYVLMGGELPAMVVLESSVRHIRGVIGNQESLLSESFTTSDKGARLLEAPQYTKPAEFFKLKVPDVLLSGNHKKIAEWRKEESIKKTKQNRPDLLRQS